MSPPENPRSIRLQIIWFQIHRCVRLVHWATCGAIGVFLLSSLFGAQAIAAGSASWLVEQPSLYLSSDSELYQWLVQLLYAGIIVWIIVLLQSGGKR